MKINPHRIGRVFILSVLFLGGYVLVCENAVRGRWPMVLVTTIFVAVAIPVWVTYLDRGRLPWHVLNPKKQSWAFMFGDSLCLAPALALSAVAWDKNLVPEFAHTAWWRILMLAVGVVAGYAMTRVDRIRYQKNNALAALKRPDKIVHDRVVVPVMFSSLLTVAAPLLFAWTWLTTIVVALIGVYGALLVIDDKWRTVDPKWQYDIA